MSVGLSVSTVSPTETTEPIEMSFGTWTQVGPRNYVDPIRLRSRFPTDKVAFERDDVGIFPHTIDQCSDWPAAEAIECHIIFCQSKIPPVLLV